MGECTITLEDVAVLLGLRIDGKAVIGQSSSFTVGGEVVSNADFVEYMLGARPRGTDLDGACLSTVFLNRRFSHLPNDLDYAGLVRFTRGYIMRLLAGMLIPNKTANRVHICYLSLLHDLHTAGRYSWGSAVLVTLYRFLY